jgi:xylulose-5-phosphate/fructose-6-phosphate phosphoketolase
MVVLNALDRFHLAMLAVDHLDIDSAQRQAIMVRMEKQISLHNDYIREHGEYLPTNSNCTWKRR